MYIFDILSNAQNIAWGMRLIFPFPIESLWHIVYFEFSNKQH